MPYNLVNKYGTCLDSATTVDRNGSSADHKYTELPYWENLKVLDTFNTKAIWSFETNISKGSYTTVHEAYYVTSFRYAETIFLFNETIQPTAY